jgi:hypothetical protein
MANTFLPWEPEKKKKTFLPWEAEDVVETQEEETGDGWWETTKDVAGAVGEYIPDPVKDVAKDVGGGMMGAIHWLAKPQSGVMGAAFNVQEELMKGDQPEDDRSSWERYVNESLEGMKKGVTYEDEKRFQDLIEQANPEWVANHPKLSTIIGFAGDVATDPLNLLLFVPVVGPISVAARVVHKLLMGTSTGRKLIDLADNPILRGLNVYTGDKKKAREVYLKMLDETRGQKAIIGREHEIKTRALRKAAKTLGVSVDDLNRQILRETEGMAAAADVPANLTGAAREKAVQEAGDMREMFGEIITKEQSATPIAGMGDEAFVPGSQMTEIGLGGGVPGAPPPLGTVRATELGLGRELVGEAAERPYLPHILSSEGEKELQRLAKHKYGNIETMRDAWKSNPNAIRREIGGTVEDINLRFGKDFFVTDAATISAVRQANHATQIASRNFLKETAETLGRRADDAPDHWVTIKGIEGVRFDPKLAPFINDMHMTISDPKKLGAFLKFTDSATRWWKMWSLGLRPAYHARNVIGNLWNAYNIGGMSPASGRRFTQAGIIQRQGKRKSGFSGSVQLGKFKNEAGGNAHAREDLWRMAQEDGIMNHGQYGADVIQNMERYALNEAPKSPLSALGQWITPSTKSRLLHKGFATGTTLENNARLALYLDTLAKTGSRKAARANVKKSLFDYADLSPFEQNVMKRFIPFYTWSRKNIPAQIEALIKNPQRAVKIDHLIDNIQYGVDTPSLEETNEFLRGRKPVWIDKFMETGGEDVHNAITLMNWIPYVDPDRLLDWKPIRGGKLKGSGMPFPTLLAEMTNPFLKSVFEFFGNYDIYRRRDIDDIGGRKVDFLGIRMPVHLAKLAQNMVMLSELDRLNPAGMFGEKTRSPEGEVTQTRAGFKPPWQKEAALRESRLDQPVSMRWLQYLVGLRPYENTGDVKAWEKMSLYSDYKSLMSVLRREGGKGNMDTVDDIKRLMQNLARVMGE